MKLTMEISSIENSNLHIQIKNLNICTTHSKTHGKSRDFPLREFIFFNARLRRLAAARRWRPPRFKHLKFRKTASGIYHDADVRQDRFQTQACPKCGWRGTENTIKAYAHATRRGLTLHCNTAGACTTHTLHAHIARWGGRVCL